MSEPPPPRLRPRTLLALLLLLLAPLALAVPRVLRPLTPTATAADGHVSEATGSDATATATVRVPGLPDPVLGFAINAHHIGDMPLYLYSIEAIADLGANTLIVVTPAYQTRVTSNEIADLPAKCPRPEQLVTLLRKAKDEGLATILMPIVLIEKPGEKEWRGVIRPTDLAAWWTSYDAFLDRFIAIANEADVDMLSIGSELNFVEDDVERWHATAKRVRASYDGVLTYSANWDRYDKIEFWPAVDVLSVSSYFELERDRPGAPTADLARAWTPFREALVATAARWNRPLLLSEVGYPALPWANAHPWNYVAGDVRKADGVAQARCWRAFFSAWTDAIADPANPALGFCGYRWDPYHAGGPGDTGYGIVGKPAHEVVRNGLRRIDTVRRMNGGTATSRPATAPASPPASPPATTGRSPSR